MSTIAFLCYKDTTFKRIIRILLTFDYKKRNPGYGFSFFIAFAMYHSLPTFHSSIIPHTFLAIYLRISLQV